MSATRSRVVKLTYQGPVAVAVSDTGNPPIPIPLVLDLGSAQGFLDYVSTYSEYRLLKAVTKFIEVPPNSPESGESLSWIKAPSRPYLIDHAVAGSANGSLQNMSLDTILRTSPTDLRQSRYQKSFTLRTTSTSFSVAYYPYTLQWSGKPLNTTTPTPQELGTKWLQYYSGRRWTPMAFQSSTPGNANSVRVPYFGPYICVLDADGNAISNYTDPDTSAVMQRWTAVTTVYCQFRGQK